MLAEKKDEVVDRVYRFGQRGEQGQLAQRQRVSEPGVVVFLSYDVYTSYTHTDLFITPIQTNVILVRNGIGVARDGICMGPR